MKFNMKELMKKITAGGTAAVMMVGSQLTVFASGEEPEASGSDYSYEWIKGKGNGTFDKLTNVVQETGASLYQLLLAIGVVGLVAISIFCGIKLASAGPGKRADALEQIIWVLVGGVVVFGSLSFVGYMGSIGANL